MLNQRLKKIYLHRRALWDMTARELKAKYAGSRLGLWWAVITPLLLAVSINFVFTKVFKLDTLNYTLFVLAGIIPWFFLANSLMEATDSFITRSALLRQAIFPREFIPLASILANFLSFLIGFFLLLPLFIILNAKVIPFIIVLFPVIILQLFFVLGLGLLFSCINVFFRDMSHFLSTAFMVWFWVTPIFYSLDTLPFPFRAVCLLNPMSYYVVLFQAFLFEAKFPNLSWIVAAFFISLVTFFVGYLVFIKQEAKLLKRI